MPTTICTAAVEHRVGSGNGAVLVTGVKMAQQLEKATRDNYRLDEKWFSNHHNPCYNLFLKLAPQHCLSRIRSLLRLRGAAGRPGRHTRLRAHLETRSQMPILRLVNSRGIRLTRNIMNYEIDRFATRRTIPRRAMRTPPGKIGIPRHEDTSRRCSLGSITRSMLRRPARPGHELRMSSLLLGLPRLFFYRKENRSSRLNVSAESASAGMSLTRKGHANRRVGTAIASSPTHCRLATCDRVRRPAQRFSATVFGTAGRPQRILACDYLVTCFTANLERYAYWTAGARASVSPGSPVEFARSALLDLRWHQLCFCLTSSAMSPCGVSSGRLQRILARNCCFVNSDSHSSWTAGARASVSPGSPVGLARSRILDPRPRRLRFCSTNSPVMLRLGTTGRLQHSPARNCLLIWFTFSRGLYTCWTAGARESASPGSPVGSALSVAKCLRYGLSAFQLMTALLRLTRCSTFTGRPVRAKAFRQVHQLGQLWQLTTIELGITSMEPFMTGLPLLPIATLSLTPHDSSRQSVGAHGNIT